MSTKSTDKNIDIHVTEFDKIKKNKITYPFTHQNQYPYSPFSSLHISFGTDKENLFNNQVNDIDFLHFVVKLVSVNIP